MKHSLSFLLALTALTGFAGIVHYDVPPMSDQMRLPDAEPYDSVKGGVVRIVLAQDEYEPGSFVVISDRDEKTVDLKLSEFKTAGGKVLPAPALDLKVVKCWYQNGNAWYSYFGDTGFKLCPELLLNGDPEFYKVVLKPIVEELDAAADKVKLTMTDAEVKELGEKYLSRFLNIRYTVAQLRARYLKETL